MGEPTLNLDYDGLAAEVGHELGYTSTSGNWDAEQTARIDATIQSGLRSFYAAQGLGADRPPHRWSFLYPVGSITTVSGQGDYDLPDDYGYIDGPMTYRSSTGYYTVNLRPAWRIRELRQGAASYSDKPSHAAIRAKVAGHSQIATRYEILLYPTPGAEYTLEFEYRIQLNKLASGQYPLGGSDHAETILAACLMVAESRENRERGLRWAEYLERLQASIAIDTDHEPRNLGPNHDRRRMQQRHERVSGITYNGVEMT